MKQKEIELNFFDISYFQKYEMHEEALEIALKMPLDELGSDEKCRLYKLMCLSYRKLGAMEEALIYINYAIEIAKREIERNKSDYWRKTLGICLMNKGVIYDAAKDYEKASNIYHHAITIFKGIDGIEKGIIVNALINYGEALYNFNKNMKALFILREALMLIDEKEDMRYGYIKRKMKEIEEGEI